MDRKKFIKTCCIAGLGAPVLSVMLQSCSTAQYFAQRTFSDNRFIVAKSEFIGEKKGEPVPRKYVLIGHEKLQFPICIYDLGGDRYTALYLKCTHRGCEVKPQGDYLVCPCHGSEFTNTGKVIQSPAEKDLQQFNVLSDEENVYVQL
ncbi:MAG: Rieske (2Fe-2S) protein [Cyclobacteriaceae bacterium]